MGLNLDRPAGNQTIFGELGDLSLPDVREILLSDGWHTVEPGSLTVRARPTGEAVLFLWLELPKHRDGGLASTEPVKVVCNAGVIMAMRGFNRAPSKIIPAQFVPTA